MRVRQTLWRLYDGAVIERPAVTLIAIAVIVASLAAFASQFRTDASTDSLMLENDEDLRYYRSVTAKYSSQDFLIITYTPQGYLFDRDVLTEIGKLRDDVAAVAGVSRVVSLLDVPLLTSPGLPLAELSKNPRTLETPGIDLPAARREFLESPLYRNLLLSRNGRTTAILAYLEPDRRYEALLAERERLRELKQKRQISAEQERELEEVSKAFKVHQTGHTLRLRQRIAEVRAAMDRHRPDARIFLGGVPMIVADMLRFIENDLVTFGIAVTIFLVLTLLVIFRRPRWVVIPMLCTGLTATAMIGALGMLDRPVSVISANFVALLLVITMSMTIHLVVRYRETQAREPGTDRRTLVRDTMHFMFKPCIYTSLTTIVAFTSLLVSGIRPVIDFGQIMTIGIVFAFFLVFSLFPASLMRLPRGTGKIENDFTAALTAALARFARKHRLPILGVGVVVAAGATFGITQLKVENRFIDYFREHTEIHRGMIEIDRNLGGTTPFDVILDAPPEPLKPPRPPETDEEELLGDYFAEVEAPQGEYWLTPHKLKEVKRLHDYFDAQPEIGKVLSLATLVRLAESLNDNRPLGDIETAFLRKFLSDDVKRILLAPYLSEDGRQLRFNMRIVDSDKTLNREALLERIQTGMERDYEPDRFRLTGVLVLYNNMLQSLYESQILTLGAVFFSILLMFIALFRSWRVAVIAILPNLLAAALVLGVMGWFGIPLDLMTIMIAAISVGIAVDNTIHYVIRFRREFARDQDYGETVARCHGSIGKAVYYTSITITAGFSILALSNFIPTVYFGLLTGVAMLAALIASLTLLPALLMTFKPFGPGTDTMSGAAGRTVESVP